MIHDLLEVIGMGILGVLMVAATTAAMCLAVYGFLSL